MGRFASLFDRLYGYLFTVFKISKFDGCAYAKPEFYWGVYAFFISIRYATTLTFERVHIEKPLLYGFRFRLINGV